MSQTGPEAPVIELGVGDADDRSDGASAAPVRQRRQVFLAVAALLCLLALTGSIREMPGLDAPLWTGSVSLNGVTLGPSNLYMWRLDGKAVIAVDLLTGRPRWSRDITDLPDSIMDLGNGVVVVSTRQLSTDGTGPQGGPIELLRADTGELIAQTVGDYYQPTADGRLLFVSAQRHGNPDSCASNETNCADLTAWNVQAGTAVWRLSLPANSGYVFDGQSDALVEVDADGTLRVHDLATGAVSGTMTLSAEVMSAGGQIGLLRDSVVIAQHGPGGITVTAYGRPSLNRIWSVVVPDFTAINDQGAGYVYLGACGTDLCLTVTGGSTWVINEATGAVNKPIALQVVQRLGNGMFLASPATSQSISDSPGGPVEGLVVDANGRTHATVMANAVVDWSDSGDRALLVQQGPQRTGFQLVDGGGTVRPLGSVPGADLTCRARADIVACADARGTLRVWRLPL
jgi:outer membrane protein assembly factor BamB